jgi:hypothetical protein
MRGLEIAVVSSLTWFHSDAETKEGLFWEGHRGRDPRRANHIRTNHYEFTVAILPDLNFWSRFRRSAPN